MPGKMDEKKWARAKEIVAEQKGHAPKGKDFGLVQHIAQGMKKDESNSEMAEATTTNIERKAKYLKELMEQANEDSPPWVVGMLAQAKTHVQDVMDYVGTDGVKKGEKSQGCVDCAKELPENPDTNPEAGEWMVLKKPEGGIAIRCPDCTDKKHGIKKSALAHLKEMAREIEKSEVPFQLYMKIRQLKQKASASREIDRLQGNWEAAEKEVQALKLENARLREALEHFATDRQFPNQRVWDQDRRFARAALEGKE